MGKIYTHMGISEEKLRRKNSIILDDGNKVMYDVNYNKRLIVNMEFMGQETIKSNVNSCGWKEIVDITLNNFQVIILNFSAKKINGQLKMVHLQFVIEYLLIFFPEYKDFLGDKLIHHHIGEDGQAVALPVGLHTGYGIVHNIEKELGVTKKMDMNFLA